MKTYFIEPGDWESATGESLPKDSHGIFVVSLDDFERLRTAPKDIMRHQEIMCGPLWKMSEQALEEECKESK